MRSWSTGGEVEEQLGRLVSNPPRKAVEARRNLTHFLHQSCLPEGPPSILVRSLPVRKAIIRIHGYRDRAN